MFRFVLAGGSFAKCGAIRWGEVQRRSESLVLLLQFLYPLFKGLEGKH